MPHFALAQVALPCSGVGHAMVQSPQCAGEAVVSTQAPLQLVRPPSQMSEHLPAEQTLPTGHTLSHDPQRPGSLRMSTHAPSHALSGASQLTPHTPALQEGIPPVWSGHAVPQAPQLLASLVRSTHTVPQGA